MTQESNQTQERKTVMDSLAKSDIYQPAHFKALHDAYDNHPEIEPIMSRLLLNFDRPFDDSDGATVVGSLAGALLRHKATPKKLRRKIAKEMRRLQ